MITTDSFIKGYVYGRLDGARELSRREIEEDFPAVDPDSFAQGMLDGLARDEWRLKQIQADIAF